jgi:dTMP kinase
MCSIEKFGAVSSSRTAAAIRVYPELRRVHPELRTAPVFSRPLSHRELSHPAPLSTNRAKLNRQTPEIERLASRRKQTPAICSNRQKINFCLDENLSLPASFFEGAIGAPSERLNVFLPGSGLRVEMAVTHSKQSIGPFLPGSRFAHMRTVAPLRPYARLGGNSMPARGKFIVLEGIDGSGKRTQLEMLVRAFASRGVACSQISFPRYDGFFGRMAGQYLNGDFGSLEAVDPHFSALLYAGDRFEAKPRIESDLASGQTVVADRYIGSNLAHQSARVPPEKRAEFLQWLKQLEYQVYALPAEDLVIYLRVPPAEAHRLVGEKAARDYTKLRHDIHESDLAHLQTTSEVYDQLARQPNWVKIECNDSAAAALRAPESIHQEILAAVQARVTPTLRANK